MEKLILNRLKEARILVFLFILLLIIILLTFSRIQIEVLNLKYKSIEKRHLNQNYEIVLILKILDKIPILKLKIDKKKLEKLKKKEKLQKRVNEINLKIIENKNKFDKNVLEAIKKANIEIKKINLKIEIGTENAFFTSLLIPVISTIVSILIRRKIKNIEKQRFIVNPIYCNQNIANIEISGIFEIKMIHIINIIYILNKKEGVKKNERTSNRRSYDYSYE